MKEILAEIDRVLKGKDRPKTKPNIKVKEKDETYKDMFRESYEQKEYPEDDDSEHEKSESAVEESDEHDEFAYPSKAEAEKRDPGYKQDVGLIRMMLTNKLKQRLTELRGKTK